MGVKRLDRESDRSSYWKCVKMSLFCLLRLLARCLAPGTNLCFPFTIPRAPQHRIPWHMCLFGLTFSTPVFIYLLYHLLTLVQSHWLCLNDSLYAVTCNKTSLYLPVVFQPVTITCNLRHLKVRLSFCQILQVLLSMMFQHRHYLNLRAASWG